VAQQIISTLETRINVFGLRETKFQSVQDTGGNILIQVEMAGGTRSDVDNLLAKQGKFEGKIPRYIELKNGKGEFIFGSKSYTVEVSGSSMKLDGLEVEFNKSSRLDGIEFQYANITNSSATLLFNVFTSKDIKSICIQDQPGICVSKVNQAQGGWQFVFQVFLSKDGAERFATVTKGLRAVGVPGSSETYLESRLLLFLDDKLITDLSIASSLAGQALTEPTITGGRPTKEEAQQEKLYLQSILQSGALPVRLDVSRIEQISATLGQDFLRSAILAGAVAAIAVAVIVFIRYRNLKIAIPVVLTSLAEVILILGGSTLIHWTIDLAAIAAIIAVVGTGVDAQIMIVDEILAGERDRTFTLKQKVRRAFFIIFGSASTVIAAMLPLIFIGVGVMRGFAITTIMGVLIGIFITRPAFSRIAETILEKKETV
jgi:protein-export membrane protein SecD